MTCDIHYAMYIIDGGAPQICTLLLQILQILFIVITPLHILSLVSHPHKQNQRTPISKVAFHEGRSIEDHKTERDCLYYNEYQWCVCVFWVLILTLITVHDGRRQSMHICVGDGAATISFRGHTLNMNSLERNEGPNILWLWYIKHNIMQMYC